MAEEDRFTGIKHTRAYPEQAVEWLLSQADLTPADIDIVAYNFAGYKYLAGVASGLKFAVRTSTLKRAWPRAASFAVVHSRYRERMRVISVKFPRAQVRGVDHHRNHGLYTFAASGFEQAAVLIADNLGEVATTSIASAEIRDGILRYKLAESIRDPASLGYAYSVITKHLGWRRNDEEGTVMALAALGDPDRFRGVLRQAIQITEAGFALDPTLLPLRVLRNGWSRVSPAFVHATCPPRNSHEKVEQVHADLAAALQERTEQVMIHLARRTQAITNSGRLCLGGGLAMNCVALGKILATGLFDEIFIPSAPGDSGTAIGAAIAAHIDRTSSSPVGVAHSCYLGPAYTEFVPTPGSLLGLSTRQVDDPAGFLAAQLAEGRIVGLFQGRLEAGPRALGNRSILASPTQIDVVRRLNAKVKFRESFRPFAPVVLADKTRDYFELTQPSPYMAIAVPVTELARRVIPSIVHNNGTARVQTLCSNQNQFLAEVLVRFEHLTGVPVLINTSLNSKGKPICGTPQMAIECLASSGLDGLMMDNGWWIYK
jgi:carbamoyltransferase